MKRLAALILSALLLFSFTACDFSGDSPEESESSTSVDSGEITTLDTDNTETDDSIFISQEEKNAWRDKLIYILSRCEIQDNDLGISGSVAAGLMDLDFDNTPEVILAYPGGSMGNAPLEIYDLNTGEKLDSYNTSGNINFYIAQKSEELVILDEGAIRIAGADYVSSIVILIADRASESNYLRVSPLFSRSNEGEKITYKYKSEIVDKAEYDTLYQQFLNDYIKIEETQIQLVKWATLGKLEWKDFGFKEGVDPESKKILAEKMADALINSSQEFINYNNKNTISENKNSNPSINMSAEEYREINTLVTLYKDNLIDIKSSNLFSYLYWEDRDFWDNRDDDKQSNYQFAVVDMNGDGICEIILRRFGEKCIVRYNDIVENLKPIYLDYSQICTDGTYGVSGRAGREQMTYQFNENWESTCLFTCYLNPETDDWEYYIGRMGDTKVSEEEFFEYSSHFSDTLIDFFDLTEDNINKYITVESIKKSFTTGENGVDIFISKQEIYNSVSSFISDIPYNSEYYSTYNITDEDTIFFFQFYIFGTQRHLLYLLKGYDGGKTWYFQDIQSAPSMGWREQIVCAKMLDDRVGLISGHLHATDNNFSERTYITTNGGKNWTQVILPSTPPYLNNESTLISNYLDGEAYDLTHENGVYYLYVRCRYYDPVLDEGVYVYFCYSSTDLVNWTHVKPTK